MRWSRGATSDPATPAYLDRLQLGEAPFAPVAGERFFHADPGRVQLLHMVPHLLGYSEELLLITGPAGSGKTTLLAHLANQADAEWKLCCIEGASVAEPADLFMAVARCFGVSLAGREGAEMLPALCRHLEHLAQGSLPVLAVDDAHCLSDDALEMVLRLAALPGRHGRLLRVLLLAEPPIAGRLAGARFGEAPQPHRLELKPLDESQTAAYLRHRLAVAGLPDGDNLFPPRRLRQIHKAAGGWPGRINRVAHTVLEQGMTPPWQRRESLVAAATLVATVVVGGAWLALSGETTPQSTPEPQTLALPLPSVTPLPAPTEEHSRVVVTSQGETLQITCTAAGVPVVETLAVVPPEPEPAVPAEPPAPSLPAPAPVSAVVPPAPPPPAPAVAPPAPPPVPPPPAAAPKPRDAAWLAQRNLRHFTVQLVASGSEQAVRAHLEGHLSGPEVALVRTQREGKDWFIALWGDYPDRKAARHALATLPQPLRQTGPWVRSFADLQQEVRSAGASRP